MGGQQGSVTKRLHVPGALLVLAALLAGFVLWLPGHPAHMSYMGRDYVSGSCNSVPPRNQLVLLRGVVVPEGDAAVYAKVRVRVTTPDTIYVLRDGQCVRTWGLEGGT